MARLITNNNQSYSQIMFSAFTLVEYSLFTTAIYLALKRKLFKRIVLSSVPLFLAAYVLSFIFFAKDTADSISITVEYSLVIVSALLYFFEEINQPNTTFIYSSFQFWAIVGILIYSTGTFFLFMYSQALSYEEWSKWEIINYVFTWIKNMCFSVAACLPKKSNNFSEPEEKLFPDPFYNRTH
ncbi:MAG: hypothetical protein QM731_15145 [Chitinophagaceae bacterium]